MGLQAAVSYPSAPTSRFISQIPRDWYCNGNIRRRAFFIHTTSIDLQMCDVWASGHLGQVFMSLHGREYLRQVAPHGKLLSPFKNSTEAVASMQTTWHAPGFLLLFMKLTKCECILHVMPGLFLEDCFSKQPGSYM